METLQQEKDICNKKYEQSLKLLNAGKDFEAKRLLVDVMENMFNIAKNYPLTLDEREFIDDRIKKLLKLSKSIGGDETEETECGQLNDVENTEHNDVVVVESDDEIKKYDESFYDVLNEEKKESAFNSFVGQERAKSILADAIKVAKIRRSAVDNILLFGAPGLGKTALARIIAEEMGTSFIECSAPTIKDVKNLINIFKNIKKYDIIFIDEIHRLSKACCESLYTAIQDKKLSYIDKEGNNCEVILPDFTLIGATTHSNDLAKPFKDRFYIQIKMLDYSQMELVEIIKRVFDKNVISISQEALKCIANRSRGVPRVALGFASRIIDRCIVGSIYQIDENFVETFFEDIGVDENGLNEIDRKYLKILASNFAGCAVGIDTLSSAMNEDRNIVEGAEPYLIYLGLINITKSGRKLTEKGKIYLDEKFSNE